MSIDQAGTPNSNQQVNQQSSIRQTGDLQKQIHPTVKFNPRQETSESATQNEHSRGRGENSSGPSKTAESAPSVDSTSGGL